MIGSFRFCGPKIADFRGPRILTLIAGIVYLLRSSFYVDNLVREKPKGRALPRAAISLCLGGHHPIHSRSGYSSGYGLNASFTFGCPRSSWLALGRLMSTLASQAGHVWQTAPGWNRRFYISWL